MCVVSSWMVDSRYFHRKDFLMVEAAEEEGPAVEWSVLFSTRRRKALVGTLSVIVWTFVLNLYSPVCS